MEQGRGSTFCHQGRRFIPVRISSLGQCRLPMDLFLRHVDAPTLYRAKGIEFTPKDAERLLANSIETLFIPADQHGVYRGMLGRRLSEMIADTGASPRQRAGRVRESCAGVIEDVLAAPRQPEGALAVAEISAQLAAWAVHDRASFAYLLDMSAHDFYTATHMVNVGAGCGLLLKALRPTDAAMLPRVIQGGLLHDIGKRGVPEAILTKVGKLTAPEWQAIRKHPRLGFEELRDTPGVPEVVLEMVRDHHERLDGRGYPNERRGDQIGFAARVCAVVDVYDALTSHRQYRRPLAPLAALSLMAEGVGTHFDAGVLGAWCELVQGLLDADPARAPRTTDVPQKLTLETFLQHFEVVAGATSPQDRRRHPRFKYNTLIKAAFLTQGNACPVKVGEDFPVLALDLGQSGMQLRTPWAPAIDDVLRVHLSRRDGTTMARQARVVRVEITPEGSAHVGLRYLSEDEVRAREAA